MQQEVSCPQSVAILVIVSRPLDLGYLPNLADQWALQSGLKRVQEPAFLKMLRPPTVEGLRSEILSGYDIVHFDGHGASGKRCPSCGALHQPQANKCDRCAARSMEENTIRAVCLEDDEQGHSNWESDLEELVRCSFLEEKLLGRGDRS